MFSGIVEEAGSVKRLQYKDKVLNLAIQAKTVLIGTKPGDSIAVNGVCLTVTSVGRGFFEAQAIGETLSKTNLGLLKISDAVNLERSLKPSDRISGHFVSGHIDAVAKVKNIIRRSGFNEVVISMPSGSADHIVEKGSVAMNGISLTVSKVGISTFSVSIIPHTWKNTNLDKIKPGDSVNIETDMLGKYVVKYIARTSGTDGINKKDFFSEYIEMSGGGISACN